MRGVCVCLIYDYGRATAGLRTMPLCPPACVLMCVIVRDVGVLMCACVCVLYVLSLCQGAFTRVRDSVSVTYRQSAQNKRACVCMHVSIRPA